MIYKFCIFRNCVKDLFKQFEYSVYKMYFFLFYAETVVEFFIIRREKCKSLIENTRVISYYILRNIIYQTLFISLLLTSAFKN